MTYGMIRIGTASALLLAAPLPSQALPQFDAAGAPETATAATPVNGLLCGRGWHWSMLYFKCERNRHRCPAGTHWISLIRTCVSL